jgi:hypothetical protein
MDYEDCLQTIRLPRCIEAIGDDIRWSFTESQVLPNIASLVHAENTVLFANV